MSHHLSLQKISSCDSQNIRLNVCVVTPLKHHHLLLICKRFSLLTRNLSANVCLYCYYHHPSSSSFTLHVISLLSLASFFKCLSEADRYFHSGAPNCYASLLNIINHTVHTVTLHQQGLTVCHSSYDVSKGGKPCF